MNTAVKNTPAKSKKSLTEYYSAQQVRTDRWTALRMACEQLTQALSKRRHGETVRKARDAIEALRPVDHPLALDQGHG
ncbi:hypothetical protein ACKVEX_03365 [Rhodocyclaceae bacterium SMB388]